MRVGPGRILGPYKVLSLLGQGGMSSVFRAADMRLGREVALKVIPNPFVDQAGRLRREARALSRLDHPNIVKVFDIAQEDGIDFIVMELVPGRPLLDLIAEGPLEPVRARGIAIQTAEALDCAHRAGVVHRDLKPGNIIAAPDGRIKILDFGIAKIGRSDQQDPQDSAQPTFTGTLAGTPSYMAPEHLQGQELDGRADIFSLGVVIYEMLAGRRPFPGRTYAETMALILYRDPAPLRGVPPALERIVMRCLRKDPGLRFSDAGQLLAALREMPESGDSVSREPSVAVLPFANLSPDPSNVYFSDGLSEEIILALQRVQGLRVIARSSSFRMRDRQGDAVEAGRRLDADYVVEGSVRWSGSRIRVHAELVPSDGGAAVWSERWDAELTDAFRIQDDISGAIADKLRAGLARPAARGRRHSSNPEAYAAYLRARHVGSHLSPSSVAKAREHLATAIALDPDYALAYTGSAYLTFYGMLLGILDPAEHLDSALGLVGQALQIDPELAEAHAIEGALAGVFRYEWNTAARHFERAFAQDSGAAELHYLYGRWHLWPRQLWAGAEHHLEISSRLDPLSALPHFALAETFYCQGRWDEAMKRIETALELSPGFWMPLMLGGQVMIATGRPAEARYWFRRMADLIPGHPWVIAMDAAVLAAEGRTDEARARASDLRDHPVPARPGDWAGVHLDLGDTQAALACLEQCIQEKNWLVFWMAGSQHRQRQFGGHPGLAAIAAKLNIGAGSGAPGVPAAGP